MAKIAEVRNTTGVGGLAGRIAREGRPSFLARLFRIAAANGGSLDVFEAKLAAAEYVLRNRHRRHIEPALIEKAATMLKALVEDDACPHRIAIRAGALLDGQSARKTKRKGEAA